MTLGSHQRTVGKSQDWITPRWIIDVLGPFDLDPCACSSAPWNCARDNWTRDGLNKAWFGRHNDGLEKPRVWLNPPFDRYKVGKWIARLAAHGRGTALLHARTEAAWFEPVWEHASGLLFLVERIHFHYPDGKRAEANSGAPAVLCSFGAYDLKRLSTSGIAGWLVTERKRLTQSPTIP